jgi:hypothetical protein
MNHDAIHTRAQELILKELVEGICASEQRWLVEPMRECQQCSTIAAATGRGLQSLKSMQIVLPEGLARKTQFRVRLRAQQISHDAPRRRLLWASCGASWLFGAVSAPYVWRGLQWLGARAALPRVVPELGFGLWWALPAIAAAAIIFVENARSETRQDWFRHQD